MKCTVSYSLFRQYAAVFIVNLGVMSTGISLSWSSPVLVKLRNETESPLNRPITEDEGSWIVSGGYLLSLFCIPVVGILLDVIGRKYCVLLISLLKAIMAILLIFATEVWMLIFIRTMMVTGDCMVLVTVPVYASEIASKEHRGALGTFLQIFSTLGIVTTMSVGPFLSYINFSIVVASIVVITTVPILCLPDSPFYLYSKGRTREALEILKRIRINEEVAKEELLEYELSSSKAEEKLDKSAIFKNKTFLKSLCLGTLLCAGSQVTGFNAVQFYLQTILESTHTSIRSEIASVIIGVIQFFASFCTTLVMSLFGRRPILLSSLFGMFLGMLGLGTFFKISAPDDYEITGFMNYLPIISLIVVIYCYSAGIGSLLWLVTAELFDGPARAVGMSCSVITSTLFIFLTTKYFVLLTSALGPANVYWLFCGMTVILASLIAIFIPETKGKSFSEIQKALGGNSVELEKTNGQEHTKV